MNIDDDATGIHEVVDGVGRQRLQRQLLQLVEQRASMLPVTAREEFVEMLTSCDERDSNRGRARHFRRDVLERARQRAFRRVGIARPVRVAGVARLVEVYRLTQRGEISAWEIADRVGYSSYESLRRSCIKLFGVPPRKLHEVFGEDEFLRLAAASLCTEMGAGVQVAESVHRRV